uniref:leucine-rich repeat domain-containing protein n=1 Tax=Ruminococcus flavefaciens TaxID=1265 RepID=UPI00048CE0F0
MLRNRLIAGVLSAVMCTSAVLPNQALNNAGQEANAATTKGKPAAADYEVKSTNSLGNFFQNAAAKEDVQNPLTENACNSQFQITSLEFDSETGTVRVASTQQTEAKIVVSFVNDETSENVFSVETTVEAGKLINSELKADASKLPQYYLVKAQLFDPLNRPAGKPYTLSRYTKEYQEILATDIHDFDQEQVVNLDEDETTNFLVLNEDTVKAESSEEQNNLVSADYDNNVFVFDNADDSISSLQEGEYLYIQPDEENIIAVNVEKIEKDGDTVTVSGNDDIEDMFDFIKIESEGNMSKAQVDASYADEGMSFPNIDENGIPVISDDGTIDFHYEMPKNDIKFNYSASKTFSLNSILEPQTEDIRPNDPYWDAKVEHKEEVDGSVTVSVNFNFVKKFMTTKLELTLKITPSFTISNGFSGSAFYESSDPKAKSIAATIAKISIPTSIPAVDVVLSPRVFLDFSGNIELSLEWDNVIGFAYDDGDFQNKTELFKKENINADFKISGEIYAGLELKVYLKVKSEKIAAVGFDFKAGLKVSAEASLADIYNQIEENIKEPPDKVIINNEKDDKWYHACKFCIKATTDFVIKVNVDVSILRRTKSWKLLELSINIPFLGAYLSSENGFGFGECDYNRFRTTFNVISNADGGYIPADVKLDNKEATVGPYGAAFYCLPGTYNYTVSYEGKTLESGTVTVKNSAVDMEFKEDVTVDDSGNFKGYTHGDTKSATGANVTKATTTKRVIVTGTLPALSFDKDEMIAETGELGENISYMLYPDGYLYICGYGDMYDFDSSPFRDPSIVKNTVIENVSDEIDGEMITSIGNNVFYNCSNMTSISMPNTIKRIGNGAFRNCSSLPKLDYYEFYYETNDKGEVIAKVREYKSPVGKLILPKAITSIGNYSFCDCNLLNDIAIPETLLEIGSYAFANLKDVTSIAIPETVKKIGDYAFSGCSSIETAVIKGGSDGIGNYIFS